MPTPTDFDLNNVRHILSALKPGDDFTSAEAVKLSSGEYVANVDTPVCSSRNANFGKSLSKHRNDLGIEKLSEKPERIKDDHGRWTTTTRWVCIELVPLRLI